MVALAALGMALSSSLVSTTVDAAVTLTPKSKIVTPKNADVIGTCKFTANRVTSNFVRFTLNATARPADLDGYRANVFTQVHCYLFDDTASLLAEFHPIANGPSMYGRTYKDAVPFFDSYILCGQAEVKKKNGDTTSTPLVCS